MAIKENEIQRNYFNSLKVLTMLYPELIFVNASSNGAVVSVRQAIFLKQMGLRNGFPDVFLPFPTNEFKGTFIEFKTSTGRQSNYQKSWETFLKLTGYNYLVCRSEKEATDLTVSIVKAFRSHLSSKQLTELEKVSKEYKSQLAKK